MAAVNEIVNVTAPADRCSYVFAPQNKAAGGTALEWAHYRLCQATNALLDAPAHVYDWFKSELGNLWSRLHGAWQSAGTWVQETWTHAKYAAHVLYQDVTDFAQRVWDAIKKAVPSLAGAERWGLYALIGIGALAAIWLTEK